MSLSDSVCQLMSVSDANIFRSIHFNFSLKVLIGLSLLCVSVIIFALFIFWSYLYTCNLYYICLCNQAINRSSPNSNLWWSRRWYCNQFMVLQSIHKIHLEAHRFLLSTFLFGSSCQIIIFLIDPAWFLDVVRSIALPFSHIVHHLLPSSDLRAQWD